MTETFEIRPKGAPWHLWLVGVLGIFWNGYGGYDYVMTKIGGDQYLRDYGMTEPQIEYFHAMPSWMTAVWAIGVWGAILGTILLLLRRKLALPVFIVSFAAFLVSILYQYLLTNGAEINGTLGMIMSAVITAGCLFFIWYSWAMTRSGVLK
jgi:hypothetical protein